MDKTAIILSYNRPIYLWATLDSLYRSTKSKTKFILLDQGSTDKSVLGIIKSFVNRGLLDSVLMAEKSDPFFLQDTFSSRFSELSDVFFYIESDVVIKEDESCWTDRMLSLMDADQNLAMLGSRIDEADFVSRAHIENVLGREATEQELNAIKWFSPERKIPPIGKHDVASPFNPPGRLLALRKDALRGCPTMRDGAMHDYLKSNGWATGITGAVQHRHLSLYNFFDYPDYSMSGRDQYMEPAK